MKSKYWLYAILALAIISVIVISGCIQQQSAEIPQDEELIQISQNNFRFLEQRWLNSHLHDYEKSPYWCYYDDRDPPTDGVTLKYKLIDIPEEYQKYIRCKVYDGATPIHRVITDLDNNGKLMTRYDNDPEDIRGITVGLTLNEDHDLNICCCIYDGFHSDKPISNEVCFSHRVNKIECDRNLEREERFKSPPPPYFTEQI